MLNLRINLLPSIVFGVCVLTANNALAVGQFDAGIPASWTCTGNCGTSADVVGASVVSTLPTAYGWVSTYGGVNGVSPFSKVPGNPTYGGEGVSTNGTVLRSTAFSAVANEVLKFDFNYVTSDGGSFADYGWARLLNAGTLTEAAIIFTARTTTTSTDNVVPGFGLPNPNTTLTPGSVPIIDAGYVWTSNLGPEWSPLGQQGTYDGLLSSGSSGTCWYIGCGYTGWVGASYQMINSGNYVLEFGVTNWDDTAWDSGMAFNTVTIGKGNGLGIDDDYIDDNKRHVPGGGDGGDEGDPVSPVPEPETYAMLLAGLGLMGFMAHRRKHNVA